MTAQTRLMDDGRGLGWKSAGSHTATIARCVLKEGRGSERGRGKGQGEGRGKQKRKQKRKVGTMDPRAAQIGGDESEEGVELEV